MQPRGPILSMVEDRYGLQIWAYPSAAMRVPGAFRTVSVHPLLLTTPTINLYEWADLDWKEPPTDLWPRYAAISHVWKSSDAVVKILKIQNRPLRIDISRTDSKKEHEIAWPGLIHAAYAAKNRGCNHMWLDLLCLDQVAKMDQNSDDDKEKSKQIKNMGKIYQRASAVLVMVGGVGAVQPIDEMSSWINRAWTLQEASLCKETYAVVDWPYENDFRVVPTRRTRNDDLNDEKYHFQFTTVVDTIKIISLLKLLTLDPANLTIDIPHHFRMRCFDSDPHAAHNVLERKAGTLALQAVMKTEDKHMRSSGAWRCMFLRISEKPQDMIFSMMDLIGVSLEVDYSRTLADLYADVAKQVAAHGLPAWLGIGSSNGDIIPRDPLSGLWPELPKYQGRSLPTYNLNKIPVLTAKFVSRSADYISSFDLQFTTPSTPHIVCCRMFDFQWNELSFDPPPGEAGESRACMLHLHNVRGVCMYKGDLGDDDKVVIIGQTKKLDSSSGQRSWYIYFLREVSGMGWIRVGSGGFDIIDGELPQTRTHITVGNEAQTSLKQWVCDCRIVAGTRTLPLPKSYGIISRPLDDNGQLDQNSGLRYGKYGVSWYANKGDCMEIRNTVWNGFHQTVSDEEWNKPGPVSRTVDLYSHTTSINDKFENYKDLEAMGNARFCRTDNTVTSCGQLKYDLKSNDVDTKRVVRGQYRYRECNYWIGVEYRPNVIYLRIARSSNIEVSETNTAVIPSWEIQV